MKSIRRLLSRLHRPPSTEDDDDEDEDEVGGAKAAAKAAAASVAAARDAAERGTESFGSGGSSFDSRPSIRKGSRRMQRAASRSQRTMEKKQLAKRSLGKRLLGSLQWMHIREDVPSRRQRSRFLQSVTGPESVQIWKNNLRSSVLGVESIYDGTPYVNTGFVAVPRHVRYVQGSSLSLRPSTRVPVPLGYINEEKSSMRIMRSSSRSLRPISGPQYLVHEKQSDVHPVMTSAGRGPHGGWTQVVGYSEELGTNPQSGIFTNSSATVHYTQDETQGETVPGKIRKSLSPRRIDGIRREREKKVHRGDDDGRMTFIGNRKDFSPDDDDGRSPSPSSRRKTCINIVDDTRQLDPPFTLDQAIEESVGILAMKKKYGRDEDNEEAQVPFSNIMKRSIRPNEEKLKLKLSLEKMKRSNEDIEDDKRMSKNVTPIIMRADDEVTGKGIIKYPKGYTKQDKARSVREVFGLERLENKGKPDAFNEDIRLRAMRLSANKAKALIHGLEEEGMSRRAAVKAIIDHQKREEKVRFQRERPSQDHLDKQESTETYNNNDDEELKIRLPSNKTSTLILRMEEEGVTGRATVKSIMDQMKHHDKMRLLIDVPSSEKNEGRESAIFSADDNAEEEVKIRIPSNKTSTVVVRTEDDSVSGRKSVTEQMKQQSKSRLSRRNSSHEKTEEREKSEKPGHEEEVEERTKILSNKGSHIRQVDDELKGRPSQKSVDQKKLAEKLRCMKAALEQNENASKSDIQSNDEDKIKLRQTRKPLPDEGSGDEMNEAMRRTNEQCLVDAFIRESVLQSEKRLAEEYPKTLDDYLNIPIREAGKRSWSRIKAKYMNSTERPRTLTQRTPINDDKAKREDFVRERVSPKREKNFDDMVNPSLPASSKGKRSRNSTDTTSPVRDVVHRPRIPLSSIGRLSSEDSENEEWDQIFDAPPKLWAGLHASSKPPRF